MQETERLLKLKSRINAFATEDSQCLIQEFNLLSEKIKLTDTQEQAKRNVTDVAYYLRKIYDTAREQIEKFSETESTLIINKYKKVCKFFIGASAPTFFSFFLKKIDNDFLNSKVLTESFFLDLAREMLQINKVKKKEKNARKNESISSDSELSILEQLEMIVVLTGHDEASKCLDSCKDFIDGLKSNAEAGLLQSTQQMLLELATRIQSLFNIAQNDKDLQAICVLFRDFADVEEQSKPCVSNCVKSSQSSSEKITLSIAQVILKEEGFFKARLTVSDPLHKFRFSQYQKGFSPVLISLEQKFFATEPTLPEVPTRSHLVKTKFSYSSSEFEDCHDQISEASSSRNSFN